MPIPFERWYCEEEGQLAGLPEGWTPARADWDTRLREFVFGREQAETIYADKMAAMARHHIVAAGGFIGTPDELTPASAPDARGGVRVIYPTGLREYTCAICGSPVRWIPPQE